MQKTPEVDMRLMKKRQENKKMGERLEEALGATADKHARLKNPQTGEINRYNSQHWEVKVIKTKKINPTRHI